MELAIEELSLSGWPCLQTVLYDGWALRFAAGHTKRSNSVNALYPGRLGLDEKIAYCEAAYAERGLPAIFKILDPSVGGEVHDKLDAALVARGYERLGETEVMTLELDGLPPLTALPRAAAVSVEDRLSPVWVGGYCASSKLWAKREIVGRILENSVPKVVAASARSEGGGIVACGYGAIDRGWVGLFDIVVKEDWRGRGLGEAVVRAILDESARRGAERAYLQVVSGNAQAKRLYQKLGFGEAYRYWYRRKDRSAG